MIRTEVLQTKNLRKSLLFKIVNIVAILLMLFILFASKIFESNEQIKQLFADNYRTIIRPTIYALTIIIIGISLYVNSKIKSPIRLGAIEIDEDEFRYIEHDEILETYKVENLKAIDFEFYSIRMRSNPLGALNYLTLQTKDGKRSFEITVGNNMEKAELGDLFRKMNTKIPVTIRFSYFMKKLLKDKDLQI